ncbi:MAG: hypothetical protein OHK93_008501 [Ramalina farinacea]|uniref:non-specific serine/threonine protein kinase n=1 Tax=Ramalina farinacea TaxID=258253 RepID=A0AA43QMJ9_9LECA|nr:hypothetical protein [Ramalina farinacea]
MAINFFISPRSKQNTPYATPVGYVGLFGREDMLFDPTEVEDLQRINNRFLQEPEQYDHLEELGVGGNGWSSTTIAREVFLVKHRLPNNDRIIRIVDYLHSAHVRQIQIYMEYCDGGDLQRLLDRYSKHGRTLPESFAWHAFRQIAEGLAFIHCGYDHKLGPNQKLPIDTWKTVIHADLKPENIFLRTSKISGDYPDLLLADFGNSHTEDGFHRAGTEIWLPPERRYVSGWGDTWTMGAIISSFAWRGAPPSRPDRLSDRTFQRGLDYRGLPIQIRHQFESRATIQVTAEKIIRTGEVPERGSVSKRAMKKIATDEFLQIRVPPERGSIVKKRPIRKFTTDDILQTGDPPGRGDMSKIAMQEIAAY